MKLPYTLAKRFVAGESLEQTVPKVSDLNDAGIRVTLDLLGENVKDKKTADDTLTHYIELIEGIHEQGIDSNISIKLTMLGLDIDYQYCKKNLFSLLDVARKHDQFVRIDMEGSDYTQLTIDLFKEAFQEYGKHVGIVIQTYLHRTRDDINMLAELGADIRLCKGAYNESERIALRKMSDIREAYKEYAAILFEKTVYPRIATHDDQLIEWVKTYTDQNGIGKSRFEFQMLYGMRLETCKELAAAGYNVRIYVPYGTMWFPYFSRRLKERKENIWFVLSTMFQK
ncbi:MAG: proline dehydrogenase family protein [Balneolales bacterium]|nr:proline dehydrogenase family protein [Balneolales bacterium]